MMMVAPITAPLTMSERITSLRVKIDDGLIIQPRYRQFVRYGASTSHKKAANTIRSANGSHLAQNRLDNPNITSCAGRRVGAFSAYIGSKRNLVLQISHFPNRFD